MKSIASKAINQETFLLLRSESSIASRLLLEAMTVISRLDFPNESRLAYILFGLSLGLERFLKILYLMLYFERNGHWAQNGELKSKGHDLRTLTTSVSELAILKYSFDRDCFEKEPCRSIIGVLTDFAKGTRYYNLDRIAGAAAASPFERWQQEVEVKILQMHQNKRQSVTTGESFIAGRLDLLGSYYAMGYGGNPIISHNDAFRLKSDYDIIRKYLKMYLGRMCRELVGLLHQIQLQEASMLAEFFAAFLNNDAFFRNRKTFNRDF